MQIQTKQTTTKVTINTNACGLKVPTLLHDGKTMFYWTTKMDLAFKKCMNALMAQDFILACPNHNKPFHIYTDASSHQLGAHIVQMTNLWPYGPTYLNVSN